MFDYEEIIKINTSHDAETFVANSGVIDWEWSGKASANGFAEWVYLNCRKIDRNNYDTELRAYLTSVGENPSDYCI